MIKLKFNIVSIYLAILIAGGWLSYSVYHNGKSIQKVSQTLTEKQLPVLNNIAQLKYWLKEYERILYELYATTYNTGDERKKIYRQLKNTEVQIELNQRAIANVFADNQAFLPLKKLTYLLKKEAAQLDEALPPAPYDWDEARSILVKISQHSLEAQPQLDGLSHEIEAQVLNSKKHSNQQLDAMSKWVALFSAIILMIAILVGYYIRKAHLHSIEKQRLAQFLESNPNPVACINFEGETVFENVAWNKRYSAQGEQHFVLSIFSEIKNMREQAIDFSQFNLQEEKKYLEITVNKNTLLQQFMIYVEDVTEKEIARKELEFFAYHDELTGLANLKKLELDLDRLIVNGKYKSFCLISVGVRRLQLITTTHGHSVSDALIRALVIRMQNCLTDLLDKFKICRLYRFTGAKFEILIAGKSETTALNQAIMHINQKINDSAGRALQTSYGQFYLDLKAGYVFFPEHGYSGNMLIKNASAALNEAQKHNAKQFVSFDHELAYREQNWYQLENDMRQTNFDDSFFLTYQPKFDLKSNQLIGMEALVRWEHNEKGLISPVEFIPIAEESGLIMSLGEWILNSAVKQMKHWLSKGKDNLQIAVNVSPS